MQAIFKDLVKDIQALQYGEVEFQELVSRYPDLSIGLIVQASNWLLTEV